MHDVIQSEERADAVVGQASVTLSALGEIEEWLARYTKLLGTMGQDVHQIEAQNKVWTGYNRRACKSLRTTNVNCITR